jgi:UPF0271 protein
MQQTIDINADVGEGFDTDAALLPYLSSANIACGAHAGSRAIFLQTATACLQHGVAVGAHPGFADKANFGRHQQPWTPAQIYDLLMPQLELAANCCAALGATLVHVKPHGALYNQSAADAALASCIARVVYGFSPQLVLVGLSGSHSVVQARALGLRVANEAFADRAYLANGSIAPRSQQGAVLASEGDVAKQVLGLILENKVHTATGEALHLTADTLCLHGDGPHAVQFAQFIYQTLKQHGIRLKAF